VTRHQRRLRGNKWERYCGCSHFFMQWVTIFYFFTKIAITLSRLLLYPSYVFLMRLIFFSPKYPLFGFYNPNNILVYKIRKLSIYNSKFEIFLQNPKLALNLSSETPSLRESWRFFDQKHHISSIFKHQIQGKVSFRWFLGL